MFFNRSDLSGLRFQTSRSARSMAALALAVATTAPVLYCGSHARADEPAAVAVQPAAADAQMLAEGVQLFNRGQYEEAQLALARVNVANLAPADQTKHRKATADVDQALAARRNARAEFELGEQALARSQYDEAIKYYKSASQNPFADQATRSKAQAQILVAQVNSGNPPKPGVQPQAQPVVQAQPVPQPQPVDQPDPQPGAQPVNARALYKQAKSEYEKGDYTAAKLHFLQARHAGVKTGLFEDSPDKYLKRIAAKEKAQQEAAAVVASANGAAPAPAATGSAPPANDVADEMATQAQLARVRQQQQAYEATLAIEQARKAQAENRYADALQLYVLAAKLDPNNQAAQAGRAEMEKLVGASPRPAGTTLDDFARQQQIRREAANYLIDTAVNGAENAVKAGDFPKAREELVRARVARDTNAIVFSNAELSAINARLADLNMRIDQGEATKQVASEQAAQQQALQANLEREQRAKLEQQRTVKVLIRNAKQLTSEGRYRQALGVVDQILSIDPNNDYAMGVRQLIQDHAYVQEQKGFREQFDRSYVEVMNAAEEKKIPYSDVLAYPVNWPDIVEMRDAAVKEERGQKPEELAVQAQLDRRLPEIRFDAVAFADVIDFLRDITGSNIFVNWRALEAAGVDRNAPVSARLRDIKFSKALSTILQDVGGGQVTLGYTISEGVISISTSEDLARNTVTRVYDIRDLIVSIPDYDQAPDFSLTNTVSNNRSGTGGSRTGGGFGGGGGLFGGGGGGGGGGAQGPTRQELVTEITKLIMETVAPDTWREAGGTIGALRELSGQLIVTQTPENHRELVNLLEQLRETRAIQVNIEARFLTVTRNYLEDIGVDVDFFFNIQDPNNFSPISVSNNTSVFTRYPDTGVPGSIGAAAATGGGAGGGGSGGDGTGGDGTGGGGTGGGGTGGGTDGFAIGGPIPGLPATYLDNFQVNFLIRATQAAQNQSFVTAPRVTLFNGQRAYVSVGTQRSYVSDLNPVVGTRSVAYDPTIDLVGSGTVLDVQATVSADRKYVTLNLRPQITTVVALRTFPTSGGTVVDGGDDDDDDTTNNNQTTGTGFIQQPEIQTVEIRTSVSVPDGGTILLGGQTIAGEIERESGVPILSKIPFLKRLTTNRSMAKDESVLLVLVKPQIIIQREQEAKQFPLLSSRVSQ